MTYEQILMLSPVKFSDYLVKKIVFDDIKDNTSIAGLTLMGKRLIEISSRYTELSSLLSYARVMKRNIERTSTKEATQDMIDKTNNIEAALKALDIQYKAINRNICLKAESNKELFLTGALT